MSETRDIKIGAKVDSTLKSAASAVKRELEGVGKQLEALGKTMGQGKNSQSPGFGKQVQNQIGDLKKLQKQAGDTYKAIASEAERQAQKEVAHLKRIDQAVQKLTADYNSLTQTHRRLAQIPSSGTAGGMANIDRLRAEKGGMLARAVGLRETHQERLAEHQSIYQTGGVGAPGGGGQAAPPSQPPKSRELSNADIALIGSAVGRAIGGAMQQFGSFAQSTKNIDVQNAAAIAQGGVGKFLNGALQGDVRLGYAYQNLNDVSASKRLRPADLVGAGNAAADAAWARQGRLGNQLDAQAGGQVAGGFMLGGQALSGGVGLVGDAATIIGASGGKAVGTAGSSIMRTATDVTGAGANVAGHALDILNPAVSYMNGGLDVQELNSLGAREDNTLAANPFFSAAADMIQQEKHARASAGRRLMGQHLRASGIGSGYGYGREESFGIAGQLQGMTGMQGMFDQALGGRANPRLANLQEQIRKEQLFMDLSTGPAMTDSHRQNLANLGKQYEHTPGMVGQEHRRGLLQSSMALAGAGIDMGVGMGSLTSIFGATNNSEKAMQTLEKAVSLGTTRGFTDPRAQQNLVQALGQAAQSSILKDTTGLDALANLLTGGGVGGGQGQVAQTQARVAALGGADRLSANPYFQGKSIAAALTNGSTVQQGLLGTASITDLVHGGQRFEDLGITPEQRYRQARTKLQQQLGYAAAQSGDPEIMNLLKQSGGSGAFFGGDEKKHSVLRRTFARLKEFDTDQGSEAISRLYENMDNLGPGGAKAQKLNRWGDAAAEAAISIEERTKQKLEEYITKLGVYMEHQDNLMKAFDDVKKAENKGDYKITAGKVFKVRIINEDGALPPPPAPDPDKKH